MYIVGNDGFYEKETKSMMGSVLIFFIISFFLNVVLSKNAKETNYSIVLLLMFLNLYLFYHLSRDTLLNVLPLIISSQLLFVATMISQRSNKKEDPFGS